LTKHQAWYVGDGTYGDAGVSLDYYNSFVIQPMLVEALDVVGDEAPEWKSLRSKRRRASRAGRRFRSASSRPTGLSDHRPLIAYRCGAFQGLALAALRQHAAGRGRTGAGARLPSPP